MTQIRLRKSLTLCVSLWKAKDDDGRSLCHIWRGVSSVVGFPLSALWVAGSNPVVGRSFQSSLEGLSPHVRIRGGVTGYFSEG